MATFFDLPIPVREKIYRLHLVQKRPITFHQYYAEPHSNSRKNLKDKTRMPAICWVSKRLEKEASVIYYGENHFEFDGGKRCGSIISFREYTRLRHFRLVRKITFQWPVRAETGDPRANFLMLAKMKNLQELRLRVDEKKMVSDMLEKRYAIYKSNDLSGPQQQLLLHQYPGMTALLTLCGVPHVEFRKAVEMTQQQAKRFYGGPIHGGFLETQVLPKLKATIIPSIK